MGGILDKQQKADLKLSDPKRQLTPLENMIMVEALEEAEREYKQRQLHTLTLVRRRAGREDVPLDAKLFAHLQLETTNLFHNTLHVPHAKDEETISRALDRLIASCLAVKVILAEEKIVAMTR